VRLLEELSSNIDNTEELTPNEKIKAKQALADIPIIFGKSLEELNTEKHPVILNININRAPWTKRYLISLVEAVMSLKAQTNGIEILKKLRNKDEFSEALVHLSVGKCMVDYGFHIEFVPQSSSKTPDWSITHGNIKGKTIVELTKLSNPNPKEKDIVWTSNQIPEKLFPLTSKGDILYAGVLLKEYISMPVLRGILPKIYTIFLAAKDTGFASLIEGNKIKLAFATKSNGDQLKEWAMKNNIIEEYEYVKDVSVFRGPRFNVDETYRVKERIEKKKAQLQKETLNIIIIRNDRLFHSYEIIDGCIDTLEEFVYKYEYLSLLIILGGYVRQKRLTSPAIEDRIERNNHLYLCRGIDQFVKQALIITNNYSMDSKRTLALSESVKEALTNCQSMVI